MKAFLVGLTIVAATIGVGVGYASKQTTSLPEWYTEDATSDLNDAETVSSVSEGSTEFNQGDSEVVVRPHTPEDMPGEVTVSEGELSVMVTEAISSQPQTAPILQATKDIRTSIEEGRIESGAVMNLSQLPTGALPAGGQQAVEQLTKTFPFIANRDVYLGIEGSPTVVNGSLSLDDTHIKIGQLRLPAAQVARQLGISQGDIERQLGKVLEQQGITPENIDIIDGALVIKETVQ